MPTPTTATAHATQALAHAWRTRPRYRTILLFQAAILATMLCLTLLTAPTQPPTPSSTHLTPRTWRGFPTRPETEQCYKQERVATLFALYLGVFGADHWYARHWVLAIFKLLTFGGFTIWAAVDVALWIVGGFYGTPGCPGGSDKEWLY